MTIFLKYAGLAILSFLMVVCSKAQSIKVGSRVPEFKLFDQDSIEFDIKSYLGMKNLVIYFYPKDETYGCTKEACSFRDQYEVFQQADAMIIGISGQSVDSHKKFAEHHKLPFTLLSDPNNIVRKLFGVATNPMPGRVSFVIDKNGIIVYTFDSQMEPTRHVDEALRILKEME